MNNDVQHNELEFEDTDFVEAPEGLAAPEIKQDQGLKVRGRSLRIQDQEAKHQGRNDERSILVSYVFLPVIFLTVALFGGVRVASDGSLVFLRPELICLVFAAILLVLFVRARLIDIGGWVSESFGALKNIAGAAVIFSIFASSVQLFNLLLPEAGIPFWIAVFCLFWMLWTYLFAEFSSKKLVRGIASAFGFLFVVKYLVLANLVAPASENWLRGVLENPSKEAFTWLLDLPRFAPATGYIQFFTIVLYLAGIYLLPQRVGNKD